MKSWRTVLGISLIFLCLSASACTGSTSGEDVHPPTTFKESDLIGTWQASYGDAVTLRVDGTYQQVFQDADGYRYESPWNKWWVEYRSSGWIYVHLEDMRYYASTRELGERGGRGEFFWDWAENRTFEMIDEVILRVESLPLAPRGIGLVHMKTDADNANVIFTLADESSR